jgi:hypothetical protein
LLQTDFIAKLINLIEINLDKTDLIRHCCLHLVSLIIGVENVDEIFKYKNNLLLDKAIEWLEPNCNQQLHVASAVIIAHYLRAGFNFIFRIKIKIYT